MQGRQGQRRFPRVPTQLPGELRARVRIEGRSRVVSVPVSLSSLAPEGAGVVLPARTDVRPVRGMSVTLHFVIDGADLEIPARVAWCAEPSSAGRNVSCGVRFHLELAPFDARQTYAEWIVAQLTQRQTACQ